jgi:hypothetical protein
VVAGIICVVVLAGCGGSDLPELGQVTGTVKMDGNPLAGATVTFAPEKGAASTAVTDASGRYELVYIREHKGALLGLHSVRISKPSEDESSDVVPAAYNTETTLSADVKSGPNQFDFDVKSTVQTGAPAGGRPGEP